MISGLDLLGAEEGSVPGWGSLVGPILQAAGGITKGGLEYHEQQEAQKKAKAEEEAKKKAEEEAKRKFAASDRQKLTAAIAADRAAVSAAAQADVSEQSKRPSASVDAAGAAALSAAQDRAGAGLSEAASRQRVKVAEAALNEALAKARVDPNDKYQEALVKAWTATANKAQNRQIVSADVPKGGDTGWGESWWTKNVIGPIPGYGVAAGGVVTLGALGLAAKRFLFK